MEENERMRNGIETMGLRRLFSHPLAGRLLFLGFALAFFLALLMGLGRAQIALSCMLPCFGISPTLP